MKTYCLIVKKSVPIAPEAFYAYPHYFDTMEKAVEYMDNLALAAKDFASHLILYMYEIDLEQPASDATKLVEEVIL